MPQTRITVVSLASLLFLWSLTLLGERAQMAQRLDEAQRIAQIGSRTPDVATGKLDWSAQIHPQFEVDPTRFKATCDTFLAAIHPNWQHHPGGPNSSAML